MPCRPVHSCPAIIYDATYTVRDRMDVARSTYEFVHVKSFNLYLYSNNVYLCHPCPGANVRGTVRAQESDRRYFSCIVFLSPIAREMSASAVGTLNRY